MWIGGVGQEVILSVTSFYNYLRPTILGRFSKKNEQLLYLTLACETAAHASGRVADRFRVGRSLPASVLRIAMQLMQCKKDLLTLLVSELLMSLRFLLCLRSY